MPHSGGNDSLSNPESEFTKVQIRTVEEIPKQNRSIMQAFDNISIMSTGFFFIILGFLLMAYGCQALVYLNYVGATTIGFGSLSAAFGVYMCHAVYSTKTYSLKYPENTSHSMELNYMPVEQLHDLKVVII
ncbi:uncharacterized protein NPIL_561461 [Nephila pilipes]|uniref:Uncharacterized protein n=1 Tax=Nephila pilipes TaxID=299642 RepID=A0A8X6UR48_NEPPI|nr:uncharacterized protein NPIL_561461 [Nephila pilipes]